MIISFIANNNSYYSHTELYIITIVQTSKYATWQKKANIQSMALGIYVGVMAAFNRCGRAIHWKRCGGDSYS